jgi:hypothetical protein
MTQNNDSRIKELEAQTQWQDISTAPKDRQFILAREKANDLVHSVLWDEDRGAWMTAHIIYFGTETLSEWIPTPITTDTQQLAADIAKVMELNAKRTQGEWGANPRTIYGVAGRESRGICSTGIYADNTIDSEIFHLENLANADFIASAPLMANIISQQQLLIESYKRKLEYVITENFPVEGNPIELSQADIYKELEGVK